MLLIDPGKVLRISSCKRLHVFEVLICEAVRQAGQIYGPNFCCVSRSEVYMRCTTIQILRARGSARLLAANIKMIPFRAAYQYLGRSMPYTPGGAAPNPPSGTSASSTRYFCTLNTGFPCHRLAGL